ncbi:SGNH/GDSL hydrolase family protein [Candidatus Parcubacteria bacterium]|nr:SGNH/GDSL hydrolase family protein [Candidatus Parcubacteria bacterium]
MAKKIYVALGDSISIDEYAGGAGCGAASLLHRNRDDRFPDWTGRDLVTAVPGIRAATFAKDGATTATVLTQQLPPLATTELEATVVTLTVGGNDLLQPFSSGLYQPAVTQIRRNLNQIVARLRSLFPWAAIALANVYDPSDATGNLSILELPTGLKALETLAACNQQIAEVARVYDCALADIHSRFIGHGAKAGDPSQSDPRPDRDLWYCFDVEPNAWGASAVRAAFWEALANSGLLGRR